MIPKDQASLAYQARIQNTRTLEFLGFASNQRQQDEIAAENGRVAALHFLADGEFQITPFCSSSSLREYLDSNSSSGERLENPPIDPNHVRQPLRRMILLEDLPRNYIEIIGSRLRINPSFFAAHYSDPIKSGAAAKGLALGRSSRDSLVLQAPQMLFMQVENQDIDGGGLLYR